MSIRKKSKNFWTRMCDHFHTFTLISTEHPETFENFQSYSIVKAEQQRQKIEGDRYVIHPFSLFSLCWNTMMAVINLAHMSCSTFRLSYVLESAEPRLHNTDKILLILHIICILDIAVKFNVGFQEDNPSNIIVDRRRISCRYIRHWFFLDLASCLPVSFTMLYLGVTSTNCLLVGHILPLLKIAKLFNSLNNIEVFLKTFTQSYICHQLVHHLLLFIITMHWSNCMVYSAPVLNYYFTGQLAKNYNAFFLNSTDGDLTRLTVSYRYQKALFLSLSTFFGTGMSMYKVYNPDEYVVHSLIILYASMFMVYTTVLLLNIYMTAYNSSIRYHGLMSQVETCMQQKQFPQPLKKRVHIFYTYKYLEQYYKEDNVLYCLSDQLRQEITLHTCQKFVNKVQLFNGLPATVVGVILSHLKPEVFLANDLVVRAGEIGECMYFVAYGTVAIYSLKGVEVCHLEDGAHFGSVALLMKDNKRVATVVAVEISQIYRLDADHFRKYIMSNSILRSRIEENAAKWMHETVILDEKFRQHQRIVQDQFGALSDLSKDGFDKLS